MTLTQFFSTAARRWYVVLIGAALTAAVVLQVHQPAVAYWGRVTLVVLLPKGQSTADNSLLSRSPIAIASLAVQEVNRRPNELMAASPDALLVGIGNRSGTHIQLRNTGVQWVPAAGLPYIDIEAVGSSEEEVQERISVAINNVRTTVAGLQDRIQIPPSMRVFTEQSSPQLVVERAISNPKRAMAGVLLTGGALTTVAVLLADRLLRQGLFRSPARGGRPAWDH